MSLWVSKWEKAFLAGLIEYYLDLTKDERRRVQILNHDLPLEVPKEFDDKVRKLLEKVRTVKT
jgi:hypothetical protein